MYVTAYMGTFILIPIYVCTYMSTCPCTCVHIPVQPMSHHRIWAHVTCAPIHRPWVREHTHVYIYMLLYVYMFDNPPTLCPCAYTSMCSCMSIMSPPVFMSPYSPSVCFHIHSHHFDISIYLRHADSITHHRSHLTHCHCFVQ